MAVNTRTRSGSSF